jgi:hypothetical protein
MAVSFVIVEEILQDGVVKEGGGGGGIGGWDCC